jgi:hypothetical protein
VAPDGDGERGRGAGMKEHDWDGHGGCVPDCRTCRIDTLETEGARMRAALARLDNQFATVCDDCHLVPPRTLFDDGTCCMAAHANAVPPWTCDCRCHDRQKD